MKQFLKKAEDFALAGIALLIVGILAGFFVRGILFLVQNLSLVITPPSGDQAQASFKLDEAAKLDLKGLKN